MATRSVTDRREAEEIIIAGMKEGGDLRYFEELDSYHLLAPRYQFAVPTWFVRQMVAQGMLRYQTRDRVIVELFEDDVQSDSTRDARRALIAEIKGMMPQMEANLAALERVLEETDDLEIEYEVARSERMLQWATGGRVPTAA